MNDVLLAKLFPSLPEYPAFQPGIRRAPKRVFALSEEDAKLALQNALRYIPKPWHAVLAAEFMDELVTRGRIYGYRFRPAGRIFAMPIDQYKGITMEGRAFQLMIDNNLDFDIALYPYELVTYGETGQVFQNWMQYHLVKHYLTIMKKSQTLIVMSGHPLGLFPSHTTSPRVVITNGLMIGMYDNPESFQRAQALGVANYGQMTAGGWMYIGPQGIVHGTYSTLLNAGRLKLGLSDTADLRGKLFVSSGLGGMSGAQGKAASIARAVSIIAEVDRSRIETRHSQGWIHEIVDTPKTAFVRAAQAIANQEAVAIAYHGNVVDLLEYAVKQRIKIDLLSDQTSCHAVYDGGYCPVGMTFDERTAMLATDQSGFIQRVKTTLSRHIQAIRYLVQAGTYFFDYGNSFLKAVFDIGDQSICKNKKNDLDGFIFPSYVEDIMGPLLFDYGYGPFRWVCLSGTEADLDKTDQAAMASIDPYRRFQDYDNYHWIKNAKANHLVVGSKARILYQDAEGRLRIALKFNEMVRDGSVGPIMLGRDHHDTGGTDSPFRETANIKDGSNIMAEMAIQTALGNTARGMSLVALHNGGGTGTSKAINGGFGMVLDGSKRVDKILRAAMLHDVLTGVTRRAWAQNEHAIETIRDANAKHLIQATIPASADADLVSKTVRNYYPEELHR
jgi:urocanate hydratase